MKDNSCIVCYNTQFNRLTARLYYPPSILRHCYYKGLPDRIKDVMAESCPSTYKETKLQAQLIDACYWEQQCEKSRAEKSKSKPVPSLSNNSAPNSGSNPHNNSSSNNQAFSSCTFNSENSSRSDAFDNAGNFKPKFTTLQTSFHLGKNDKLTLAECKQYMDNNLCLFCVALGHKARDCIKPGSSTIKERTANAT